MVYYWKKILFSIKGGGSAKVWKFPYFFFNPSLRCIYKMVNLAVFLPAKYDGIFAQISGDPEHLLHHAEDADTGEQSQSAT